MPHDLAVSATSPTATTADIISRTASFENAGTTTTAVASAASEKTTSSNSGTLFANPTLQLNADLGIVVIEFRDAQGSVTSQIPSQRQLDAYISGSAKPPGDQGDSNSAPAVGDAA